MDLINRNEFGSISFTDDLIANIAGYTAVENYGIIGMAAKTAGDSFAELFVRENLKKGIKVDVLSEDEIDLDLHIMLQYGVSLPAVADNVKSNVKYRIEELTDVKVRNVNIFVEGIRVQ